MANLKKNKTGLTLLETLIGISLTCFILTSAYLVFGQYLGNARKGEEVIHLSREALLVLTEIRREAMGTLNTPVGAIQLQDVSPIDLEKTFTLEGIQKSCVSRELLLSPPEGGQVSYSLQKDANNAAFLEKTVKLGDKVMKRNSFFQGSLKDFRVFWVIQKQAGGLFFSKLLCLILELENRTPHAGVHTQVFSRVLTPDFNAQQFSHWPALAR